MNPSLPVLSAGDEQRLLAALSTGDRRAAEALVEQTYRAIYAALFRLCGDADLAADLTQETYRRAWSALDSFEGRCRFSTWLYRIAYTTFLNHVRRPRRLVPLDLEAGVEPRDPAPSPEDLAGGVAITRRLWRAVLALPEELRFLVTAHFWGEQPIREIAGQEGLSTVGIRKRLSKALRLLALALEEDAP